MKPLWITLSILAGLTGGFLIFHFALLEHLFRAFFGRMELAKLENDPLLPSYYDKSRDRIIKTREEMEGIPYEEVSVTADDGVKLAADYYDFGNKKTAILMHGFHSHPLKNLSVLALDLKEKGYNLLFPYERAHGKSGGKYITYGWLEQYDLLKWIEYVDADTSAESILIYGVSMGGTTVALASDKIDCDKVKALVIDCAFTSIESLLNNLVTTKNLPDKLFMPGMKRRIKHRANLTLTQFDASESIRHDKFPTLFVYGEKDVVVRSDDFDKIYEACPAKKMLLSVPDSGHAVALVDGGEAVLERFYTFINKYVY